jgi:hypothetical protein
MNEPTLREVLLRRHARRQPELDALRRDVIRQEFAGPADAASAGSRPHRSSWATVCNAFWRELVLPHRVAWSAVVAGWVCVALLHVAGGPDPERSARLDPAAASAYRTFVREREAAFTALMGVSPDAPKASSKPRSAADDATRAA